ncbi:hypothetical protein E2C06_33485 [Dankookia rubra]|uniref:Uncharacterized protein n=1 Tax=Dankookia rubra TaxID=1442381 RepID=A0A4R5Q5U6_9PROT|nr:hypothetical protein [Dankookia rubra]TDH58262.1 hypothetical protein E2C06_33485 [Dankookia rubra]
MTRILADLYTALALTACTTLPSQASTSAARDAELYEAAVSRAEADSDARCAAAGFRDRTTCIRARQDALRLTQQPLLP